MSRAFDKLETYLERAMALHTAMILFEWDNETMAPREASEYTSRVVGTLSEEYFKIYTDDNVKSLIKECRNDIGLSEIEAAIISRTSEEIEKLECIPVKEYREFAELVSRATGIWAGARKNKNFDEFAPTLKEIISYQKKFAGYRCKEGQKLYDVMLDTYEKDFDMETLDKFFNALKKEIVPLLKRVMESRTKIDNSFLTGDFKEEKQKELAVALAGYTGFDFNKGVLAVSEHPFTTNLHNHDVRITTNYSNRIDSSIFSVIHESGHGIYEMGVADELTQTILGEGTSMGMHESQSRFFENILGRSRAFWKPVYKKLQDLFPEEFGNITLEKFTDAVNKAEPGLIRTEADELTYSLHVLIRYEIEKMLIEDDLDVEKLPEIWNNKYEEYLGIRPQNAAEGVLQDIHWSQGSFGYFPSYALGSAFGAQLLAHMKKSMDIDRLLENGEISVIREYLKENIHKFGKMKTSRQILKDTTGEDFNADYYIQYLKDKYETLYEL